MAALIIAATILNQPLLTSAPYISDNPLYPALGLPHSSRPARLPPMDVTLPIPDDLAARLGGAGGVSRRVLEAFDLAEHLADLEQEREALRRLGL